MRFKIPIPLLFFLATLVSCQKEEKRPIYLDASYALQEEAYAQSGDEIRIPFRNQNGIKYVQVTVNGIRLEMIFDTGCSGTLISVAEANYLYQKGKLKMEDIIGLTQSQIADGSVVENMVINLEEVIIGEQIRCTNVLATVSANINAPLLLGNEILDRVATIKIDNENETFHFKLK